MSQTLPSHFLYMPLDGVAAYWLSLRKILANSRNMRAIEAEIQYIPDPFLRQLLDMMLSQIPVNRCRELAQISGQNELERLERHLDLLRVAIMDMVAGENPLRTLVRFTARFPEAPEDPELLLETGQNRVAEALKGKLPQEAYTINHTMNDESLIAVLLFYVTLCRRHGKAACRDFLPQNGSDFFTNALSLVVDGFDAPFIRKWMKRYKATLLHDLQRKITLSIDMCMAIQQRASSEELGFLVRAYI